MQSIASSSKVVSLCVMNFIIEWKCISEATVTVMESKTADRNAAETTIMACSAKARLKIPTAGHQRKHNACRAEIKGCVSGCTHFSRDTTRVSQGGLVP